MVKPIFCESTDPKLQSARAAADAVGNVNPTVQSFGQEACQKIPSIFLFLSAAGYWLIHA